MNKILLSYWAKASIPSLSAAFMGFFTSTLIADITPSETTEWNKIPNSGSLYLTLFFVTVSVLYTWYVLKNEINIEKMTSKQFEASLRNGVADAAKNHLVDLIKAGNFSELEQNTEIIQRLFGDK